MVTLTLSRLAYARSVFDIDDAIHVTGIPGVTFDNFFDVDRVSDTEVTVELKFNGNIDTDANLTFTVEADAVPGYFGSSSHGTNAGYCFHGIRNRLDSVPIIRINAKWERRDPHA